MLDRDGRVVGRVHNSSETAVPSLSSSVNFVFRLLVGTEYYPQLT